MRVAHISSAHSARGYATKRRFSELRRLVPIYLLILPGMLLFLVWTLYPLVYAFVMSFFAWNPNGALASPFVGITNYTKAFTDPVFWRAFENVIYYTVVTVIGQIVLGLSVALLMNRQFKARGVFRTLYYLPVITSWVIVSIIFAYLFSSPAGPVDWLLGDVLHIIPDTQLWLGSTELALPTLMLLGIWKGIGWNMVIFLAGLQSIPPELYEAARVDGANRGATFRFIMLPLLRSVINFVLVILTIGGLNSFIQMFILTNGGPLHATETLLTYAYTNAFQTFDFGYAAALTYIFAAFSFIFALLQIYLTRKKVEY